MCHLIETRNRQCISQTLLGTDRTRNRAPWAKKVVAICAVVGITKGLVGLAWDLGWFTLGSEAARRLDSYVYLVGGLLLGFIFSLILSGQLLGSRRSLQVA